MSPTALPAARSVLVTGASGLIGRQVVAQLADDLDGIERIVALDVVEVPPDRRLDGVDYATADVRAPELADVMAEHHTDTVVHLAAIVTPGKNSTPEFEYSVDVGGTENVLGAATTTGVRQLVYTSSGAAYGYHADNPVPLTESDPLRGNAEFPYAHHKRLAEELLGWYRHHHPDLGQLIFRPGTILGRSAANPITAIFDRPVVIGVRGSDAPFVLVWDTDVAACIVEGVRQRRTGIYNLCGEGTISLPEIAERIGKRYVAVPAPALRAALRTLRTLRLTKLGPEQVRFLQYRPVLANDALRDRFGFTPSATTVECFERYRRLHFGS